MPRRSGSKRKAAHGCLAEYHLAIEETARRESASEGSHYPALKSLIQGFAEAIGLRGVEAVVLPKLGGALCPDLQVVADSHVVGYVEVKPPNTDLRGAGASRQLRRYRRAFPNLILTSCREFVLFQGGAEVARVGAWSSTAAPGDGLGDLLERFLAYRPPSSRSPAELASALAHRTRHLKDMIEGLLAGGGAGSPEGDSPAPSGAAADVAGFYRAFSEHLIPDLEVSDFADLYAQTLTFGLFAARTRSGPEFTLTGAAGAVPETIGILRDAFRYISLADPPPQVRWILEDQVEVLRAADVDRIFRRYFHEGRGRDPIVHFYETFLGEYDQEERSRRGVFYTPQAVVSFIVRSVHNLLREELGWKAGLADPRVRLLDPAAGTLPFLTEAWRVARQEYVTRFGEAAVPGLTREHLLPHFFGLELMMAPYAIGHLKVGYLLREWGTPLGPGERCALYLANTLEGAALSQSDLPGMASLARESQAAERVKRELPVNVVVGNPPYSGHSANREGWIDELLREGYERPDGSRDDGYRREGGKPLGERNLKWLRNDYVKFLRFAQWVIDRHGEGVVGMVTDHGFLDNPTFRGMRESLLQSFDQLYLLDLHGNANKGELAPDGGPDENVFPIRQGVAVLLAVKKPGLPRGSFRADLWGSRRRKLAWLADRDVASTPWQELRPRGPYHLFHPIDPVAERRYRDLVPLPAIFPVRSVGVLTGRDAFALDLSKSLLQARVQRFRDGTRFDPGEWPDLRPTRTWDPEEARAALRKEPNWRSAVLPILYRPFDRRWILYSDAVIERPRRAVMRHMLGGGNLGLVVPRQGRDGTGALVWDGLVGHKAVSAFDINSLFPLYLRPSGELFEGEEGASLRPNLDRSVMGALAAAHGAAPSPEEILAYLYAVLYAPGYRRAYRSFLELDFPRFAFPRSRGLFRAVAGLGRRLVELHLLRAPELDRPSVRLEGPALASVEVSERMPEYLPAEAAVRLNARGQVFRGLAPEVWEMEIGGYQVLRRWLRERAGRRLEAHEIETFCKASTVLGTTLALQEEIDPLYQRVEEDLLPIPRRR